MNTDVHIHHHYHNDSDGTAEKLELILVRLEKLMATVTQIEQLITDMNTETNAIAGRLDADDAALQALKAQIAAGTPATQADLDAISASLTTTSARLKAIGVDPTNPIPDPAQAAVPPSTGA